MITHLEAIKERHSVRSYTDKKIEGEVLLQLRQVIDSCNKEQGDKLHIQLCLNEPQAFSGMMAKYGKFRNANNYLSLVGKKGADLDELIGYYGEKIVLEAQRLGLHTCWVAMTYSKGKSAAVVNTGEKLLITIPIGYGETKGVAHKVKSIEELSTVNGTMPDWFRNGMEAAQLAPTAINQQKFLIALNGNQVSITPGSGFYTKVDMGIVKYHFELGAGAGAWSWAK